ncbi:MAG: GTPase HflX, partial [Chloroflexi bacterium]|nr:GTPase HflX [Chloroflexota bacterium]
MFSQVEASGRPSTASSRQARRAPKSTGGERERAYVLALDYAQPELAYSLDELTELCRTAGADVIGRMVQRRSRPDPATFIGKGKIEELSALAAEQEADFIVVDEELSPTQQRNLSQTLKMRVVDRTQLILDIFAQRARTREGKLQVELAQLNYMLPRLAGLWT